jgi:hypothetical protein
LSDGRTFGRRAALLAPAAAALTSTRWARAFGEQGAFEPRALLTGSQQGPAHPSALPRWSWELIQRTSAPARLRPGSVRAEDPQLVDSPFLYWSGDASVGSLGATEIANLRRFFSLGGVLLVDDAAPSEAGEPSAFGASARREIGRVLPDAAPIPLDLDHVIYRTFYLLRRAQGRVLGQKTLDGIVRSGGVHVIFSSNDLGGALARSSTGLWELPVLPGGDTQREQAVRLAVNIAMYVLCSNYKDDAVHAPFLMRRRASAGEP